jgi:hypothetical protein
MTESRKIRERIHAAAEHFDTIESAVLTTFNLSGPFFDNEVLPAVLGVQETSDVGRKLEVHEALETTACTVFYDPGVPVTLSGEYRYVAQPVPVPGRFFHPKIVAIGGRSVHRTRWVYLAVSSANLTLSGWGRNSEVFAETWIHTQKQQPCGALGKFLGWLNTPLTERGNEPDARGPEPTSTNDAVVRMQKILAAMPNRKRFRDKPDAPWSGALRARFYASPVHTDGLASFMRKGRKRSPTELAVFSPYWADVADQLARFDAKQTRLVAARRHDGSTLSLAKIQAENLPEDVNLQRNPAEVGKRFWHMKAYELRFQNRRRVAVGSCNCTAAGLSGAGGNIEAMLIFNCKQAVLPEGEAVELSQLADETENEEQTPTPASVCVVVAWDWKLKSYRWWLKHPSGQHDFQLLLPNGGDSRVSIEEGEGTFESDPPKPGAYFDLEYKTSLGEFATWRGYIVELNLNYSERTYGPSLTANDIIASWRGHDSARSLLRRKLDEQENAAAESATEKEGVFETLNLYEFYRSTRAVKLRLAEFEDRPSLQRNPLTKRADSVWAFAKLADTSENLPAVRFLILQELRGLMREYKHVVDDEYLVRMDGMLGSARDSLAEQLGGELARTSMFPHGRTPKAAELVSWFEIQLTKTED